MDENSRLRDEFRDRLKRYQVSREVIRGQTGSSGVSVQRPVRVRQCPGLVVVYKYWGKRCE